MTLIFINNVDNYGIKERKNNVDLSFILTTILQRHIKYFNDIAALRNHIEALRKDIASLQNDVASLQNRIASLQNGIASLQNRIVPL